MVQQKHLVVYSTTALAIGALFCANGVELAKSIYNSVAKFCSQMGNGGKGVGGGFGGSGGGKSAGGGLGGDGDLGGEGGAGKIGGEAGKVRQHKGHDGGAGEGGDIGGGGGGGSGCGDGCGGGGGGNSYSADATNRAIANERLNTLAANIATSAG